MIFYLRSSLLLLFRETLQTALMLFEFALHTKTAKCKQNYWMWAASQPVSQSWRCEPLGQRHCQWSSCWYGGDTTKHQTKHHSHMASSCLWLTAQCKESGFFFFFPPLGALILHSSQSQMSFVLISSMQTGVTRPRHLLWDAASSLSCGH